MGIPQFCLALILTFHQHSPVHSEVSRAELKVAYSQVSVYSIGALVILWQTQSSFFLLCSVCVCAFRTAT